MLSVCAQTHWNFHVLGAFARSLLLSRRYRTLQGRAHSRRGPWRHLEAVEYATLEWVDWFNHRRLLEPIGNVPPAEFEASYYHSTGQLPMAALLKPEAFRKGRAAHIDHCGLSGPSHALTML